MLLTGTNTIHSNSTRCMMDCHRSRHIDHCTFAGRVEQHRRPAYQPRHTRDIHDHASALVGTLLQRVLFHRRNSILRHQHHACYIRLHTLRPLLRIHIHRRPHRPCYTHIVHKNIHPPKLLQREIHCGFTLAGFGDIAFERQRAVGPEFEVIIDTVAFAQSRLRSTQMTCAPASASRMDAARPLPMPAAREPAPVMIAVRPEREREGRGGLWKS